jgi:hypothetical protein
MAPIDWMSVGLLTLSLVIYLVFLVGLADRQLRKLLADDVP